MDKAIRKIEEEIEKLEEEKKTLNHIYPNELVKSFDIDLQITTYKKAIEIIKDTANG